MAAASQLKRGGLQGATVETLIGPLAATGLHPGEALQPDLDDVDLRAHGLTVQGSKFGKSRLVPFTPSTRAALAQYAERRDHVLPHRSTPAFLVASSGSRVRAGPSRGCASTSVCGLTNRNTAGMARGCKFSRHYAESPIMPNGRFAAVGNCR